MVVWDVASERELAVLKGHTDGVLSVAFSREGNFVVSGSEHGARVWEVEKDLHAARAKGDSFGSFSWDGKLALTRGSDGTLSAWPVTRKARPTHVPAGRVDAWTFSPDGTRVVLGGRTGSRSGARATGNASCARLRERRGEDCEPGPTIASWSRRIRASSLASGTWRAERSSGGLLAKAAESGRPRSAHPQASPSLPRRVVVWNAESPSPSDWMPVSLSPGAQTRSTTSCSRRTPSSSSS